ncbi:DNA polymerase III subunit delta' [Marininema halotolerans]|uniref:DNA polymerase-3 subunit delta n=1 Tax=Marininema halotolerans TaxID=1155944 RepID=A0A1I6TDJ9_9BACL|nr:DNA polymerase III subunit delta' [Marininema halotolerans]SFS87233.1 DNA polymerase-3 subunit delta' [Marininema halotolerans]
MALTDVVGQERVVHFLKQGLITGRIAHAYGFSGPFGVGKRQMALEFAKALNCEQTRGDACDQCRSCQRIEHGNHPEVRWIAPDGQSIKIDQVRKLQRDFSYSPAEGVIRVVIIEQVEGMTNQAANSLLKFLEEPTSRMVAVLLTENIHGILPTIISRCQWVKFPPLSSNQIAKSLVDKGLENPIATISSHLTGGIDEAEAIAKEEGFALLCERVIKWSGEIVSGKSGALITVQSWLVQEASDRGRIERIVDLLLLWLRDLLDERLGREAVIFLGYDEPRRRQSAEWSIRGLVNAMDAIMEARRQLAGPIQSQAVLERLVMAMQGGSTHVISRRSPFPSSG